MRSRPVRRVHGFGQWPPREFVSYTRSRTRGRRDYDDRRTGERRKAATDTVALQIGITLMNPFTYSRVVDSNEAVTGIATKPQGKFLGGGTNLIDLMKMGVETPDVLIDINRLPLAQIEELPGNKGV